MTTVAIEGIDGAGKGTQACLAVDQLLQRGFTADLMNFPQYGKTVSGRLVGEYLNGAYGDSLHPKIAAMLYAVDRYESRAVLQRLRAENDVVIFDRHVGSNLAHQTARISEKERDNMIDWVYNLEHNVFRTEPADLTILIRVDVATALRNIATKGKRGYTEKVADQHEADVNHLQQTQGIYLRLAEQFGWVMVDSMDGCDQRSELDISREIVENIDRRIRQNCVHPNLR